MSDYELPLLELEEEPEATPKIVEEDEPVVTPSPICYICGKAAIAYDNFVRYCISYCPIHWRAKKEQRLGG